LNGARLGVSILLIGFPALVVPAIRLARRPGAWAVVSAISIGAGFVILETALIHAALPVLFSLVGADGLAAACRRLGGHLFGASPAFGAVAGLLASTAGVRTVIGVNATFRAYARLREGALHGIRSVVAGHEAVLAPMPGRFAMAIPGSSPYVLISQSLASDLPPGELTAIVRHEMAHLHRHHQRFLILGTGVGHGLWFMPWVSRATGALRLAVERWADEEAATSPSEREHVRSALLRLGHTDSMIVRGRLTALDRPRFEAAHSTLWGWSVVATGVAPLGIAMVATLIHHIALVT